MAKESLLDELKAFRVITAIVVAMVLLSTIFFHLVEKWSWLDSYYYTIVTIATVGYGDFTPKTDEGKIAATFLIIFGIGIFATFASMLFKRRALKNLERKDNRP